MAPTRWIRPKNFEAALDQLKPALAAQGITLYPAMHRPANFIERALTSLERLLVIAAVLILAILYLFLRDWRARPARSPSWRSRCRCWRPRRCWR